MNKEELKIQALLEKISSLTTQYENQAADYRVEITLLTEESKNLRSDCDELRRELDSFREDTVVSPEENPEA